MRLMYVQDSLGTGGAERSNADLWYYLKDQSNITLKIVVLEHRKEGIEEEIINAGFDVDFLKNANFISQVKCLASIINDFKPDIVQSVLFKSAIRVRLAKKFAHFFHIEYIVNCSYSKIRYKDPKINAAGLTFFKYVNRFTQFEGVDHFVAITQEVKNHTFQHLKINPDKISVIPRGRKENIFLSDKIEIRNNIRKELDISDDSVLFVHVGRQEYQKAQTDLLKAIKLKDQELNELNSYFIFCGRKGNLSKEIEDYLDNNNIKTPIAWLGHRNDISKVLLAADVFVFPSLFEGLGGSLIEAQAAGLPIIASDIKVFEEVIKENFNAKIFQTSNVADLAENLKLLASSEDLRDEYGINSLKHFHEKFQLGDIHQRILNLYKKLVS